MRRWARCLLALWGALGCGHPLPPEEPERCGGTGEISSQRDAETAACPSGTHEVEKDCVLDAGGACPAGLQEDDQHVCQERALLVAKSEAETDPERKAAAKELGRSAHDAIASGQYDRAAELLDEAWQLTGNPRALLFLARVEVKLGRAVLAAFHYRSFLAAPSLKPELQEEAKSELTELTLRISTLTLTTPSEAGGVDTPIRVSLDGAELALGLLKRGLPVDPGEHQVIITAPGKAPRAIRALRIKVRVGEGQQERLEVELSPR